MEHHDSQAYYVIKCQQEKEELQRQGDDLDGKVKTCEKEIKSLLNTLSHLQVRNRNYRDKFMQGAEGADLERKQILDDQYRSATEQFFRKQRDLQQLTTNFDTAKKELDDIRGERNEIDRDNNNFVQVAQQIDSEIDQIGQGLER